MKAEATISQKCNRNYEIWFSGCKLCPVLFIIILIRDYIIQFKNMQLALVELLLSYLITID